MEEVFAGTDSQIDLDPADYDSAHAYYDIENDFYWLFIDEHAFIYDNANQIWSHVPATKMIASVYRNPANESGQGTMIDDIGYAWDNWKGYELGAEAGTVTGNPTSATSTTLTDTGATFNTTNDGLAGVWVTVDCSGTVQQRQITSNTATVLTVGTAWDSNPTTSCDYYAGYIYFDIITKDYSFTEPPKESVVQSFWIAHEKAPSTQDVNVQLFVDKSTTESSDLPTQDFSERFANEYFPSDRGFWLRFGINTFVYNTSDTASTPVDIISYAIRGIAKEEN